MQWDFAPLHTPNILFKEASMSQNRVELANIFQTVTQSLAQNQQVLNQADEYNQDHGDNMVQTFQTITSALKEKQGKPDSAALAYAAKKLARTSTSKSGQLYAQGLSQAATQFKGKQVDLRGAMQLLQTLIGGGQTSGGDILGTLLGGMAGDQQTQPQAEAQAPGGDLLGALLGGMAGDQQTQPQAEAQAPGSDLLGALLGGLSGGGTTGGGAKDGLDMGDLLQAGMAFFQAKQSGGSTMQALMQAFMAASGMGNSADRTQSTSLVISSFLQALGAAGRQ